MEWHEEMITETLWPVRHGRAMTYGQIAKNVEASKLTQRLMLVTRRAATATTGTKRKADQ